MTPPVSRRQALRLGALGAAGIAVGGAGLLRTGMPWDTTGGSPGATGRGAGAGAAGQDLIQPQVLSSEGGLLRVELVAAEREIDLAGRRARVLTYNGSVPGATWRLQPGDRLEVRLVNELDTPTNLHTHGLAVSPQDNGDNPFVSVAPGETFDYRFDLPEDHPPGVYWYHPHRHGVVADQLFGGLYGTILVDGGPEAAVTRERVLVLSDTTLTRDGALAPVSQRDIMVGREGELLLVNGQSRPRLSARPGERERWRVVNACTSRYLRLALPGQQVHLLGVDGGHEAQVREVAEVLLAPGNRADLLVTMRAGATELVTRGYDRTGGMMAMMGGSDVSGPATLASLVVAGDAAPSPGPVPEPVTDPDLRGQEPDARREISFTMTMGGMMGPGRMGPGGGDSRGGGMGFGFDGRPFDAERTDQAVDAGAVEEWTIRNPTPMDHPLHLHVWPMQVIEEDGAPVMEPRWRDVVNVPAQGQVRVLVDFTRHPGRSVYHCHILDHEDAGMMATVEVA